MEAHKLVFIAGMCMLVLGPVFILQSAEVVGPESSFMYANPEWSINGAAVAAAGAAICVVGLAVAWRRARSLD